MKKKRVLEVINGFGYGGIRAFIMNYLTYIDQKRFEVDIYAFGCDSSPFTEQVKDLGANIYFEPENNAKKPIKFISDLDKFIKSHGTYDVVHAHCNLTSAWVLIAAKRNNVAVRISHSHSTNHFYGGIAQKIYSKLRLRIIDKYATKKLSCGQLAGECMYGKGSDFDIIANGINIDKFQVKNQKGIEQLKQQLNIPDNVRVYANVTRMDHQKNHLFAVEVFREIHKIDPSAIFVYGGVTPSMQSTVELVKAKIQEYGLNEFCRYTGPLMNVENLYHLSDAWIYCSASEGLPFGPIELQAAGIPVLVSDVITKEIDMGLGLVMFLPLDKTYLWAETAVNSAKRSIKQEDIVTAFQQHQFDIKQSVKLLENIYEGVH